MLSRIRREGALHLMLLPAIVFLFLFNYVPLFGVVIAFQKYSPAKGIANSLWVGLDNFRYVFALPNFSRVIRNTLYIACAKLVLHVAFPVCFALMLNELRAKSLKRVVQTVTYMPHFLSWVILGGIMVDVLAPSNGIVNMGIKALGMDPVFFLGSAETFPGTMIWLDVIKEMGFNAVIYLAALTAIDPTYYEAAVMDGASRWKQTLHITLPCLTPTIVLLATLSLGNVLNAGFDEVYNLYSVSVYETGDIIDTFVYRLGLKDLQYSPSTAVGLFKSAISTIMIVLSYRIAYKATGYRII
jgi:putative aldouronate transport system permease protein